jgi:hypothetical protein
MERCITVAPACSHDALGVVRELEKKRDASQEKNGVKQKQKSDFDAW